MSTAFQSRLLPDRVVAITGCSSGIGRATAIAAASNGARLILHHLGEPTATQIAEVESTITGLGLGTQFVTVSGDIASPETAQAIVSAGVSTFGRIDVLVSNAGICPFHTFLNMPESLWRRVQDVNLNGAFFVVQAVANQMAKQDPLPSLVPGSSSSTGSRGAIVAISSISALMGGAEQTHYTPTKAGVKSLMESCSIALGKLGIRCNSILPGTIETEINREDLAQEGKREEMSRRVPLARLGKPEDIAYPVIFMASDLAGYVTGASLLVDGGAAISLQ